MKKIYLLTFLSFILSFGYSQEDTNTETTSGSEFESHVPNADRGFVTRSGATISKGMQTELGFNYLWNGMYTSQYKSDYLNPISIKSRWGIGDRVEIDLSISNIEMINRRWEDGVKDKYNFWTPLQVGVRTQFVKSKKKDRTNGSIYAGFGIITTQRAGVDKDGNARPWVIAPRPNYVTPEFGLYMEHHLVDRLVLNYNVGLKWTGMILDDIQTSKNTNFYYAVKLLVHTATWMDVYVEHFNFINKDYYPNIGLNGGLRFAVSKKFLLDVNGGLGLNKRSPDAFVGFGAAYKFGKK